MASQMFKLWNGRPDSSLQFEQLSQYLNIISERILAQKALTLMSIMVIELVNHKIILKPLFKVININEGLKIIFIIIY